MSTVQTIYDELKGLDNVYLVGGAVRDKLLGLTSHDKDFVVVGATADKMKRLGYIPIGKDFPVFLHPHTKDEYALARTERKTGAGYTGFSVDASDTVTLEEDLARRDLSINAMALCGSGKLIDPYNGQHDLEHKILRHTTEAFTEDPVRVLRLARFQARYGTDWRIHSSTKALVKKMLVAGELAHLVPERVFKETEKALGERQPQLFFESLHELGVLQSLFPELHALIDNSKALQHKIKDDAFTQTMSALRRAAVLSFDLPTRFATLTHTFGEGAYNARDDNSKHLDQDGVTIIEAFCARLRVPNKLNDLAKLTHANLALCRTMFELTPQSLHELIINNMNALKQPERFTQFLQACQCSAQKDNPELADTRYPELDYAEYLRDSLSALNTKAVVKQAITAGKTGPDLGEAVRLAQITCLSQAAQQYSPTVK